MSRLPTRIDLPRPWVMKQFCFPLSHRTTDWPGKTKPKMIGASRDKRPLGKWLALSVATPQPHVSGRDSSAAAKSFRSTVQPALPQTLRAPAIFEPPKPGMATGAEYYKCYRQPTLNPSPYARESGDPVVDDCHMCEPQTDSRKRPRSEYPPLETSQPVLKKRRVGHPSGSHPPAAFWDNLSKVWLTSRALRELDRRSTRAARSFPRHRQLHRPVTRGALAERTKKEKNWQPTRPAAGVLTHYTPRRLKDIKLFARHGGPDLSDLRGVWITHVPTTASADDLFFSTRNLSAL
jgi:hypothetical protein